MERKRRNAKNKALQSKMQGITKQAVENFLRLTKLDQVLSKILNWAENNRKGMFAITVSFLALVVFLTFSNKPKIHERAIETSLIDSVAKNLNVNNITNSIEQLFLLQKFKNELFEIQKKGALNEEDSLTIVEIYNIIKEKGDEAK
jgi:hypothetical protein